MRSPIKTRTFADLWTASGKWLGGTLRRLREDNRGGTAVLAAIMFPAVIGGFGLGAEAGYWYFTQRQIQHAADVSAHAAGIRKRAGDDAATYEAVALKIAIDSEFRPDIGTIEVNSPPLSGDYSAAGPNAAEGEDAVEVILTENLPRLFTAIFSNTTVPIRSRAVALIRDGKLACVLAMGPREPDAIRLHGNPNVNLTGCNVASNSLEADAYSQTGTASSMVTGCIHTVGQADYSAGTLDLTDTDCPGIDEDAAITPDPYRDVAEPPVPVSKCSNFTTTGGSGKTKASAKIGSPGHYCNMSFTGNGWVELEPGVYIIDGGEFSVTSANVNIFGDGVTIYLVNGATVKINGGESIDLKAATSGPYAGILFFAERNTTTQLAHTFNGNSNHQLQGAIYTPTDNIAYAGGATGATACTQVIGWTVEFTGGSQFQTNCTGAGTTDILVNESVAVVE